VVSLRLREPIPRCHWDRGIYDKNETAGSDMKSYAAPEVNNQKYVNWKFLSYTGIPDLNETAGSVSAGLIETAGFDSTVSLRPRNLWQKCLFLIPVSLRPQDPFPRSHWDHGIQALQTIFSIFSAKRSRMQNGFRPWIRALGGLFGEKTKGVKSHDTVPLSKSAGLQRKHPPCPLPAIGLCLG
jgi:hypothetical protein